MAKVLKLTEGQLSEIVMHALVTILPETPGAKWDGVTGSIMEHARRVNRDNHIKWDEKMTRDSRVDDAAWKLFGLLPGQGHAEIKQRLEQLIKEADAS